MTRFVKSQQRSDDASDIPGLEVRRAALRLLDAVLRQGQKLEAVDDQILAGLPPGADRALVLAIAGEVLRFLPDLDALIDSATAQPLAADLKARMVLRIALAQVLRLNTPAHAAIATALPLVAGGPRRLVHGVFGTLMRCNAQLPAVPTLPQAVAARWGEWGYAALSDAARALGEPPPLDIRLRDEADDHGIGGETLMPGHRRLARGTPVNALPGFAEGGFWVQNISAQLPASLLGTGKGRHVLDLCSAPGGKAMQLAAAGWRVTAVENHKRRIERLRENLTRTGLSADIVLADVMAWAPDAPVDAILLDAPCSATGIFARHPDVLYRIGAADIAALSALQGRLLARALGWLKPDAPLIYATCSMERAEGEAVIEGVLETGNARILPIAPDQLPAGIAPSDKGWLRILPAPGRDGFFIAKITTA